LAAGITDKVVTTVAGKLAINAGKSLNLDFPVKILGEYSTVKPGPLSNDLSEIFSGGKYKEIVLQKDTILYRAGVADKPYGQFFSSNHLREYCRHELIKQCYLSGLGGYLPN
jgi:filamentous hemagglutinin